MKNTYTVVLGDTLYKVAARFNTTVAALALANKIKNINVIFLGQRFSSRNDASDRALVVGN